MREVPCWYTYFMGIARAAAARSKDPRTQVGAVITDRYHRIVSIGYNGFPDGAPESAELWHDDCKDKHVVHAEVNAIANAARVGVSTKGCVMYITLPPCLPCARITIAAGIQVVLFPRSSYEDWVSRKPVWEERFGEALTALDNSGVAWRMV